MDTSPLTQTEHTILNAVDKRQQKGGKFISFIVAPLILIVCIWGGVHTIRVVQDTNNAIILIIIGILFSAGLFYFGKKQSRSMMKLNEAFTESGRLNLEMGYKLAWLRIGNIRIIVSKHWGKSIFENLLDKECLCRYYQTAHGKHFALRMEIDGQVFSLEDDITQNKAKINEIIF